MDMEALSILRCPATGQGLVVINETEVASGDLKHRYPVIDGIFVLKKATGPEADETSRQKSIVQDFYDGFGWDKDESGVFQDTKTFVDLREVPRAFTGSCIRQINRFLPRNGGFLLDAGSGPIPHDEYFAFHSGYRRRICVDISFKALVEARKRLGKIGIYVVGDLASLPLRDQVCDGAVANHVLYHIPPVEQPKVLTELHRVLSSKGVAIISYRWNYAILGTIGSGR